MSRLQDTVIDDDEESCPLCIEEFDLSDKNFRPCPCGYQICQFCFNSLKTTYEKSTCPNCRRPYDEKTIQYKIPTAEEFKADQLNKNKKQLAAKRKETEKREVEASSRRNLAGVRVKQQNLVYVIGLVPQIKDESSLLQTLRGPEYFGQYGEIEKIVVSKAKPGAPNQGIGVYVTYARKEDAALCIQTVDGTMNGDRMLRAQFGTTKYCSAFLRGETCQNKNCSFLHETGEDGQHSSLQNEPHSIKPKPASITSSVPPPRPGSTTQSVSSQPMARQESGNSEDRKAASTTDPSALPSSVSWANAPAAAKVRRLSQSTSRATPSPQLTHSALASQKEPKPREPITETLEPEIRPEPKQKAPSKPATPVTTDPIQLLFDRVVKSACAPNLQFNFSDACLSPAEKEELKYFPRLIDPQGGAKRRAMQDKDDAERARMEAEAKAKLEEQATTAAEDIVGEEDMGAGSLALGGEPEDNPRSSSARGAISRPLASQDQFSTRSMTPQQRQQLTQLPGNVQQAPGLQLPAQNSAFEMSDFERNMPQYSQSQADQIRSHQRHGSRYFNNDGKSNQSRFQNQQGFYSSGVQGPPPGLPASGTPPVSGGGMFAHGQNFTNPGFGTGKDVNDMHLRGRSGTGAGPDAKRGVEHLADPSIVQARVQNSSGQGLYSGGGNQVDDNDYPPLPTPIEPRLHSRVGSFHSRSSTPKVPPGFEHAHPISRPASGVATPERRGTPIEPKLLRGVSGAVLPVVPDLSVVKRGSKAQKEMPKADELKEVLEAEPLKPVVQQDVSLGSPKPRSKPGVVSESKEALSLSTDTPAPSPAKKIQAKKQKSVEKPKEAATAPVKDEKTIPAAIVADATATESPRSATPATTTSEQVPGPRPRTLRLTTTTSKPSTTEQATPPTTQDKSTPGSTASLPVRDAHHFPHLPASRQHSISSGPRIDRDSRPSTPLSEQSHPASITHSRMMSEVASRSSTPPPTGSSIVGSAPERTKTKNQLKKERKEKAKAALAQTQSQATAAVVQETSAAASPAKSTAPVTEVVAPIVAKAKKQKKEKTSKPKAEPAQQSKSAAKEAEPVISTPEPATTVTEQSTDDTTQPADEPFTTPDSPASDSPPADLLDDPTDPDQATTTNEPPYTLAQLYAAASQSNAPSLSHLMAARAPSASELLSSLLQSGDITKHHPFLAPPPLSSATYRLRDELSGPQALKGQEYLDAKGYTSSDMSAFGYLYVPRGRRRDLLDGAPVILGSDVDLPDPNTGKAPQKDKNAPKEDLLRTAIIAPSGTVYRHLTSSEMGTVMELEERREVYRETVGEDLGGMQGLEVSLEGDKDRINLEGGVEELIRRGEGKGVVWVWEEGDDEEGEDGEGSLLSDEYEDEEEDEEEDLEEDEFDGSDVADGEFEPVDEYEHEDGELHANGSDLDGEDDGIAYAHPAGSAQQRPLQGRYRDAYQHRQRGYRYHSQTQAQQRRSSSHHIAAPPTTAAPPTHHQPRRAVEEANMARERPVNLRGLDNEELARRVAETQRENEASRREVERLERGFSSGRRGRGGQGGVGSSRGGGVGVGVGVGVGA